MLMMVFLDSGTACGVVSEKPNQCKSFKKQLKANLSSLASSFFSRFDNFYFMGCIIFFVSSIPFLPPVKQIVASVFEKRSIKQKKCVFLMVSHSLPQQVMFAQLSILLRKTM